MTNYQFTVVIEPDEHGFHAFVPALPGCHSFGDTVEEAQANIHEAMELHMETMIEDNESVWSKLFAESSDLLSSLADEALIKYKAS